MGCQNGPGTLVNHPFQNYSGNHKYHGQRRRFFDCQHKFYPQIFVLMFNTTLVIINSSWSQALSKIYQNFPLPRSINVTVFPLRKQTKKELWWPRKLPRTIKCHRFFLLGSKQRRNSGRPESFARTSSNLFSTQIRGRARLYCDSSSRTPNGAST